MMWCKLGVCRCCESRSLASCSVHPQTFARFHAFSEQASASGHSCTQNQLRLAMLQARLAEQEAKDSGERRLRGYKEIEVI